jgi:hypothetical protein
MTRRLQQATYDCFAADFLFVLVSLQWVSIYDEPNLLVIHLKRFDGITLGGKVSSCCGKKSNVCM